MADRTLKTEQLRLSKRIAAVENVLGTYAAENVSLAKMLGALIRVVGVEKVREEMAAMKAPAKQEEAK